MHFWNCNTVYLGGRNQGFSILEEVLSANHSALPQNLKKKKKGQERWMTESEKDQAKNASWVTLGYHAEFCSAERNRSL